MVNSILGKAKEINYPEIKILDPEDKNFDASMYAITVLGKDIIIALGQAKYTFVDDNIIYFLLKLAFMKLLLINYLIFLMMTEMSY